MLGEISAFIQQYYIDPITFGTGYNIYNTITYAIIFIVAAFFVYKLLRYIKIRIDTKLIYGIIPYVILGGLLRALEDASVVTGFLFKTPAIYVLIFVIALAALLVSIGVQKYSRYQYHKVWFVIGIVILLFGFSYVNMVSSFALLSMVGITAAWVIVFLVIKKIALKKKYTSISKFLSNENLLLLSVHMFDASTTFTALNFFSYFEQHVLPSFLINILGPAVMFPLKLIVVIAVLYVLDKELHKREDLEKRGFVKLLILILGLAPGLRNLIRLVMGV